MPGKHAPESSASFLISLSRAVGGALAAVAIMTILVVALLNRGNADEGGPTVSLPTSTPTRSTAPTPTPSITPSPTPTVLAPSKVTVQVLNGTNRTRLAARTASDIEKLGYKLAGTGNAAPTQKSTIFYRKGRRAEALAFQQSFPEFGVLREATSAQPAILKVVLGSDYPGDA